MNKKQKKAIEELINDLNELDNKPKRFYNSIYKFAEAFIKDEKELFDIEITLSEAEKSYFLQHSLDYFAREIITAKKNSIVETMQKRMEYKEDKDILSIYYEGVNDGIIKYSETILQRLLNL